MPSPVSDIAADDRRTTLDAAMKRHRYQPDALIEVLHTAQQLYGYLDLQVLKYVGRCLRLPPSRVYGVATFYNLFTLHPRGTHTCVVCLGTPCYVNGTSAILDAIEHAHGIGVGGTTPDGRITLLQARCLGACGHAPVVILDGELAGAMTPERTLERLEGWARDKR
jgi:bidirectional [NiFe] hydrogenase diaphorase subunit